MRLQNIGVVYLSASLSLALCWTVFLVLTSFPNPLSYSGVATVVFLFNTGALYLLSIIFVYTWDIERLTHSAELIFSNLLSSSPGGDGCAPDERVLPGILKFRRIYVGKLADRLWQQFQKEGVAKFPLANADRAIIEMRRFVSVGLSAAGLLAAAIATTQFGGKAAEAEMMLRSNVYVDIGRSLHIRLVKRFMLWALTLLLVVVANVYATIVTWSSIRPDIVVPRMTSFEGVSAYQLDLISRGALFNLLDSFGISLTRHETNPDKVDFSLYIYSFKLFCSLMVVATAVKIVKILWRNRNVA